jgi:hypothetical protein
MTDLMGAVVGMVFEAVPVVGTVVCLHLTSAEHFREPVCKQFVLLHRVGEV